MTKIQKVLYKGNVFFSALLGELFKWNIKRKGFKLSEIGVEEHSDRTRKIIVSVTSYGRRVTDVLPYTIYSLLKQTYKPDMVILWLDYDNWNDNNIPDSLKEMQKWGLTIKFCEDLKSYKKHVPALKTFPEASVITTDDDFYYSKYAIERLVKASNENVNYICTLRAHRPTFSANNKLLPYNSWDLLKHDTMTGPLFPTTGGGCVFRQDLLHGDTTNAELFTKLCPKADDVWFYIMGVLKQTPVKVLPSWTLMMIPLDVFYQKSHRGANLQDSNRLESFNDVQLQNTMNHYNLTAKDLCF